MVAERLPHFTPRVLTRAERRREDLYLYRSPQLGRPVDLVGCLTLALALRFEFDPAVEEWVERPRTLATYSGSVELAFWTREPRDRERFWLIVAAADTLHAGSSRREHRRARDLFEAAQAACLSLEFVFEDDLKRQADAIGTWYRLLPYVQTAVDLPNRMALRLQVRSIFDSVERATFEQVEANLGSFHPADVRAVVCDLIHRGELALADLARLSRRSVVQKGVRYGRD